MQYSKIFKSCAIYCRIINRYKPLPSVYCRNNKGVFSWKYLWRSIIFSWVLPGDFSISDTCSVCNIFKIQKGIENNCISHFNFIWVFFCFLCSKYYSLTNNHDLFNNLFSVLTCKSDKIHTINSGGPRIQQFTSLSKIGNNPAL